MSRFLRGSSIRWSNDFNAHTSCVGHVWKRDLFKVESHMV